MVGAVHPTPCTNGTFRATSGGKSYRDCSLCPGGSYCPENATAPIMCSARTYCPPASSSPIPCPGGSYCVHNVSAPTICPHSTFCPRESASPTPCRLGTYCVEGSTVEALCPRGTRATAASVNGSRARLEDVCEWCPEGTTGTDPNRVQCVPCPAGHFCLQNSPDFNMPARCPKGHYCPARATRAIPCGVGTYNPLMGQTSNASCVSCPQNYYNHLEGQVACRECSSSAFSQSGSSRCSCIGLNRAFQMTDGQCICMPGFEFFDGTVVERETVRRETQRPSTKSAHTEERPPAAGDSSAVAS